MKDILLNLQSEDALLITAPPGWGKTYKLLNAIKESRRKVFFIFPLRALCDEVHTSGTNLGLRVLNLRSSKDQELIGSGSFDLVVATPELVQFSEALRDWVFILDEFHLFYYWGDSFRERMNEMYMNISSYSPPCIFLTATLGEELKQRLTNELNRNYNHIFHMNMGNQKLKNYPNEIYYYPKKFKYWLVDDYKFSTKDGTKIIFCQYRNEVKEVTNDLRSMGFQVLSCVGGEAAKFIVELNHTNKIDFIVATSVISHGVNLPNISSIYFTYNVDNLDFYLQMLGRGGREGNHFTVHVLNTNYFERKQLVKGFLKAIRKRLSNKVESWIYCY